MPKGDIIISQDGRRYLLGEFLSSGIIGAVYPGISMDDDRLRVAIKVPAPNLDKETQDRFWQELEVLQKLHARFNSLGQPAPIPGVQVGWYASNRQKQVLLLEFVGEEHQLGGVLVRLEKDPFAREMFALRMAEKYLHLLEILHDTGYTCPDRKLADLRWLEVEGDPSGRLVVLDWNVVKEKEAEISRARAAGQNFNQLWATLVHEDLYLFGMLWYQLLTGRLPSNNVNPFDNNLWRDGQVSFGTRWLMLKALAFTTGDRYPNAEAAVKTIQKRIETMSRSAESLLAEARPLLEQYTRQADHARRSLSDTRAGALTQFEPYAADILGEWHTLDLIDLAWRKEQAAAAGDYQVAQNLVASQGERLVGQVELAFRLTRYDLGAQFLELAVRSLEGEGLDAQTVIQKSQAIADLTNDVALHLRVERWKALILTGLQAMKEGYGLRSVRDELAAWVNRLENSQTNEEDWGQMASEFDRLMAKANIPLSSSTGALAASLRSEALLRDQIGKVRRYQAAGSYIDAREVLTKAIKLLSEIAYRRYLESQLREHYLDFERWGRDLHRLARGQENERLLRQILRPDYPYLPYLLERILPDMHTWMESQEIESLQGVVHQLTQYASLLRARAKAEFQPDAWAEVGKMAGDLCLNLVALPPDQDGPRDQMFRFAYQALADVAAQASRYLNKTGNFEDSPAGTEGTGVSKAQFRGYTSQGDRTAERILNVLLQLQQRRKEIGVTHSTQLTPSDLVFQDLEEKLQQIKEHREDRTTIIGLIRDGRWSHAFQLMKTKSIQFDDPEIAAVVESSYAGLKDSIGSVSEEAESAWEKVQRYLANIGDANQKAQELVQQTQAAAGAAQNALHQAEEVTRKAKDEVENNLQQIDVLNKLLSLLDHADSALFALDHHTLNQRSQEIEKTVQDFPRLREMAKHRIEALDHDQKWLKNVFSADGDKNLAAELGEISQQLAEQPPRLDEHYVKRLTELHRQHPESRLLTNWQRSVQRFRSGDESRSIYQEISSRFAALPQMLKKGDPIQLDAALNKIEQSLSQATGEIDSFNRLIFQHLLTDWRVRKDKLAALINLLSFADQEHRKTWPAVEANQQLALKALRDLITKLLWHLNNDPVEILATSGGESGQTLADAITAMLATLEELIFRYRSGIKKGSEPASKSKEMAQGRAELEKDKKHWKELAAQRVSEGNKFYANLDTRRKVDGAVDAAPPAVTGPGGSAPGSPAPATGKSPMPPEYASPPAASSTTDVEGLTSTTSPAGSPADPKPAPQAQTKQGGKPSAENTPAPSPQTPSGAPFPEASTALPPDEATPSAVNAAAELAEAAPAVSSSAQPALSSPAEQPSKETLRPSTVRLSLGDEPRRHLRQGDTLRVTVEAKDAQGDLVFLPAHTRLVIDPKVESVRVHGPTSLETGLVAFDVTPDSVNKMTDVCLSAECLGVISEQVSLTLWPKANLLLQKDSNQETTLPADGSRVSQLEIKLAKNGLIDTNLRCEASIKVTGPGEISLDGSNWHTYLPDFSVTIEPRTLYYRAGNMPGIANISASILDGTVTDQVEYQLIEVRGSQTGAGASPISTQDPAEPEQVESKKVNRELQSVTEALEQSQNLSLFAESTQKAGQQALESPADQAILEQKQSVDERKIASPAKSSEVQFDETDTPGAVESAYKLVLRAYQDGPGPDSQLLEKDQKYDARNLKVNQTIYFRIELFKPGGQPASGEVDIEFSPPDLIKYLEKPTSLSLEEGPKDFLVSIRELADSYSEITLTAKYEHSKEDSVTIILPFKKSKREQLD